jgi:argininosuccinate synthase
MKRVLLAYSGGLDTSFLTAWLTHHEGHEVLAVSVDCGGFSIAEREAIARRAVALGAKEHRFIDARGELFERVLRHLIAGNVKRGGVYPLSVGAERGLQAELLAQLALDEGFDCLAHGCTAAGNDQVRFEVALAVIAPDLEALAPVRDLGFTRAEQVAWLEERGLPLPPAGGLYSTNAGLWGLTIGGVEMLDSSSPLPEEAWIWTSASQAAEEQTLTITFEAGRPICLDGEELDPVTLIEALNLRAGALGVGRGYHLGDTLLGFKGRIAFEAPAAEVLLGAHSELEKLVLTEDQRFWKDHLGEVYGRRLHQGLMHDPLMRDIEALFASTQAVVSGLVTVRLAGGALQITGVESPHSMLHASDAVYGEEKAKAQDPRTAVFLGRILAEPARLARRARAGVPCSPQAAALKNEL